MAKLTLGQSCLDSKFEDFKKVIFLVSQLISDGDINILFGIEEDVNIDIDNCVLDKYDIDKALFNKIVENEFIPLLEVILEGSEDAYIKLQIMQYDDDFKLMDLNKEDYEKSIQEKIDYLKEMVVNDKLANRYLIKFTTNHSKIKDIAWEINKKVYDKNKQEINVKYATINIKTTRVLEEQDSVLKLFSFMRQDPKLDELIFDCDENDINYLIKTLNNVKLRLSKCE